MPKAKNLYLQSAHLYDTCMNKLYGDHDIPFFLSYAKPNIEILEIACGTGRISIPLAQKGCNITGLDLSRPMLQVLQTKLQFEPKDVRDRINYLEADMTDFNLSRKFDLIIIPLYSFQALSTDQERDSCFKCIKNHMDHNTLLIITMFVATPKRFKPGPRKGLEFYDEVLKCTVKRNTFIDGHAKAKQVVHSHYVFELLQDGKVIDTKTEYLELSYFSDSQAQDLFKNAGFRIRESYGAYDKSPIDEANKTDLIYVLSK